MRDLSGDEEQLLRDHVGSGTGGKTGWYLVPDGVKHHQRTAFFDKFILGSSASDAERKELLIKGFVGLNEQVVAPKVSHIATRDRMKLAVPKAAGVLADIALSSKLEWAGSPDVAEIFPEPLHWGLPLCVREHVDTARRMQPPEPEKGKKASKGGSERGAEGASAAAAKRGADASGSDANERPKRSHKAKSNVQAIPTVAAHDSTLSAQLDQLKAAHEHELKQKAEELLQCQARYTADMRRVRSQFRLLETSVVQAKAVLLANKETKPLGQTIRAVKFPFDVNRRPFRDGTSRKSKVLEGRPEPFEFAYAFEDDAGSSSDD